MSHSWWSVIGAVLIVEGLGPLIAPKGWKSMLGQLMARPDNQLRQVGGCLVVIGLVVFYVFY
ncbi:DUF2065 domain-containing protein [Vibrio ostreicida]|uniref:DUF2065 domain-containing protein n=1 Tax=Vibrio ostreicida TaxID=526588 RepID=A0ABT8BMJ2_9VIBR|nr:DUF2065 domain-containing protein [Vibrio ostreicida]MDN3608351.1 DUF2065 domain-containing protein [Vibrio ostreicida]NPD10821.1 DUF2065 domain-containing protein [Vibrio ostreicida]